MNEILSSIPTPVLIGIAIICAGLFFFSLLKKIFKFAIICLILAAAFSWLSHQGIVSKHHLDTVVDKVKQTTGEAGKAARKAASMNADAAKIVEQASDALQKASEKSNK